MIDAKVNNKNFLLVNIKILSVDLSLVFNRNLVTCDGNNALKNKSLSKFIKIKESVNLWDIWRIRNQSESEIQAVYFLSK